MKYFLFQLLDGALVEEVKKKLLRKKVKGIYIIQDDRSGEVFIGGYAKETPSLKEAILTQEKESGAIDWEKQWELFAPDFQDGKAKISLKTFGGKGVLLLSPGEGFGDLSHPTTYLMLQMMSKRVLNEAVVDIGTGSGILSLAALLFGAKSARGIDIDPKAVKHAKKNALLNHLPAKFSKSLPKKMAPSTFLMNMTLQDQLLFNPSRYSHLAKSWIVSGILKEQRREYLFLAKKWNWKLVSEKEKGGWLGWVFQTAP